MNHVTGALLALRIGVTIIVCVVVLVRRFFSRLVLVGRRRFV